jgi:hypothetical protein
MDSLKEQLLSGGTLVQAAGIILALHAASPNPSLI